LTFVPKKGELMMKMKRKTRLAMALGVAFASATASGPALAQGADNGQIVMFPYYTVNGGLQSLFNVTNTTSRALAVKVRFHEARNSRDVLDFNILMSPYDVWTGWVEPNAQGGATLKTGDDSCTSPVFDGAVGLPMRKAAYTGSFADGGDDVPERLQEGYVELIVMGECWPNDSCFQSDADGDNTNGLQPGIGYLTEHVDGKPRDCALADSYFVAREPNWDGTSIPTNGNPIAAGAAAATGIDDVAGPDPRGYQQRRGAHQLKGNLTLVDVANGVAGGNAALHIGTPAGFGQRPVLVTAQQFPWFLEPTIATLPSNVLWNTSGLPIVESAISQYSVINEWSSNADLGVATDWVVNFPTKAYHVDQFCTQIQASNNRWRYYAAVPGTPADDPADPQSLGAPLFCAQPNDVSTFTINDYSFVKGTGTLNGSRADLYPPVIAPFTSRWADGKSDVTVFYNLFDREEGAVAASGTAPSPAPPTELPALPYEANVIAFTSVDDPNSAVKSPVAQPIDASAILGGAPYGWLDLTFGPNGAYPLPVTGFMMKTRTFGTPDFHYGQIQNHGYRPGDGQGLD
jgi:hypothetical protein